MSVALWLAAMPPPACTKRMIAPRCSSSQSGPGLLPPAQLEDALNKRIASYCARFSSVNTRGFASG
jgi:hypothetical protein